MFDYLSDGRWWDRGLQLMEGCTKVSPGCDNCWSLDAANMRRFNPNPKTRARYEGTVARSDCGTPQWTGQVNPQWQDLDKIGRARKPQVYTFWNDLFHPGVEEEFVTSAMCRIVSHPQHFYIICTKRPERALAYFQLCYKDFVAEDDKDWPGRLYREVFATRLMLMTTAENQAMADKRIRDLLMIPGVMHGVSHEPALGMVDWRPWLKPGLESWCKGHPESPKPNFPGGYSRKLSGIDLLIAGGETGPRARASHPDFFRQDRDQAVAAGVPFFLKSLGKWAQCDESQDVFSKKEGFHTLPGNQCFKRVGKKAAGRTLDGRTWDEVPKI